MPFVVDLPRSNNAVDGCHNAFTSRVSINYPTIIKLMEKICREQSKFEIKIAKSLKLVKLKHKKYATKNSTKELNA